MRIFNSYILIGVVLMFISSVPLIMQQRETVANNKAHSQYYVRPISGNNQINFNGNTIILSDKYDQGLSKENMIGTATIIINGEDYSSPSKIEIRPSFDIANRYHSYLRVVKLDDIKNNESKIAIIQRISGYAESPYHKNNFSWRLLLVNEDGSVHEEIFKYREQSKPIYRGMLVNYASPIGIGYYSNVKHIFPSLFYPIIYPYSTGILGVVLFIIGLLKFILRRRKQA